MDLYEEIVALRRQGRRGAIATIVSKSGSVPSFSTAKMLVRDDGSIVGTIGGGRVEADVLQAARQVMDEEKPRTLAFDLSQNPGDDPGLICGGELEVFLEPITPAAALYVFGAGHVALSLYKVAQVAGFDVTVIDDRSAYANRERFPEARDIVVDEIEGACARLSINQNSSIVIVTRGHAEDTRALRWAAGTPARYVGMIGSKRKVLTVFGELQKDGVSEAALRRVHAPIGLDIGALTPEEIAVSITAELIAVRRNAQPETPSKASRLHLPQEFAEKSEKEKKHP